jgi:hypothetical protein
MAWPIKGIRTAKYIKNDKELSVSPCKETPYTVNNMISDIIYLIPFARLHSPFSLSPFSFPKNAREGTTSKCPKNRYISPILDVSMPRKKTRPIVIRGRVIKASEKDCFSD